MKKITSKLMALILSLLTVMGTMTTPAFAAEDLTPGSPGTLTERYIDESTSRELAPSTTSKSPWVKDAPAIEGYEFDSFSQTTEHIYSQDEINFIVGYPDKTVRGDRSLSRCEAVTIFSRLYNGVYPEAKQHLTEKTFSDVPGKVWYYDKLSVCYNADILSGCSDGKFRPYDPITRAEFAAMASAFAELPTAESAPFSDVSRSYWAYDAINSAAEAGWIVGYPDGSFRPESEISRAETVTLINRLRNRKITAGELRALGVQNPYTDLSESYWAYGELIEATVKHNATDWHKLNYNEENLNTVVERFVDGEGSEIAEPITTKGKAARAPRDFKNRNYLGYTTEITYVYRQGQAVMTGSKEVDKAEAKVGDTLHYTVTISNDKSAAGTLRNAIMSDTLSQHLGFVYGSVLVDGENTKYNFDVKTGLLSVNVGDIAPGGSRKVSFAAIVKDTAYGETLSNTAILSADNSEDVPVTDTSTKVEDGKPGLTAKKSVDKTQAKVGDTLTYTITAKNAEDATAPLENATLSDTLPSFVDFVQGSVMVDGASGHYSFDNGTLTVDLGDVEPGTEKTVTFQVTVNNTAYNQSFQNTAILSAENSDPVVPSDEGVTVEDGIAKMSAAKSVDKTKAKVGDTLTYTITASNADTATVPLRNVIMTDTLPKYITFNQGSVAVDGSPVRTTFNSKTRQLTAELGDIAPGQSKALTFSALVNNAAYGKKFSNTAILSADNSEEVPATDTGVTVAAGVPEGSSGAKTVSKSKADVGDTLTYSIALRNASTATADWKNVKVTDAIPEHLAFVPGSVEVDGRSSNDYSYNADTHTLTLIADKIEVGKTLTYTFRVTVEDGAQGQYIVNTAKVTSPDREDMQLPDTGVEISGGQTEPIMTKTASVKKAKPGDTFTYTVEVKNGAKATADWKNVVLSDVLPVGVELVGGTVAVDDTTTKYTLAGQVLEVQLGDLKPNESVRVTFQVKVLERAAEDIIRNVATAQGDNGKRTASDNGVEVGLGRGELSGTKTVSQTTAKVGDILTYTITAHNSDKVTANLKDVIVTDTLSEYLTLNPNTVQVDGLPARHFFDGTARQLRVELGDIAPGQTKTVTFTAAVNSNAYGKKFGNTAVITAKNGGPVTVTTPSDVAVTDGKAEGSVSAKTVDKSKAKVGDTLTYSIAVRNASTASGPWKNVEVIDVIPEHLSFISGSVEVNGRSTNDFSYNASSRTLKLIADSVEPGQTKTFSFRVTVDEGAQGMYITNTAVVKSPDREDIQLPDTGVDIDGGKTEPSLTKTASKPEVKPGDIFTYTIKVKNGSKATADWKNVTVSDVIPAGLEFVSGSVRVDGQVIAYGISGRALEIPVGDLKPNHEAVVEFDVRVLDSAEGTTITNTATGKGDNGDKTGTDPGVTVPEPTPTPTPTPDQPDTPTQQPSGTKAVDKTIVQPHETVTYTITANNTSDKVWSGVQAVDTLDNSLMTLLNDSIIIDGVKASKAAWDFDGRKLVIDLGDIQPGQSVEAVFSVEFKTDASSKSFTNHAAIKSTSHRDVNVTAPEVSILEDVSNPFTDIHYAMFVGYGDNEGNPIHKWGPDDPITIKQVCHVAYRIMTDTYRGSLGAGTKPVPDGVETKSVRFLMSLGIISPAEYPSDSMGGTPATQAQAYRILGEAFRRDFTSYIDSPDANVSRLKLASDICRFTERDTNPDRSGLMGRTFTDVGSFAPLVAEVSNSHEYTKDSHGRETWIKLLDNEW